MAASLVGAVPLAVETLRAEPGVVWQAVFWTVFVAAANLLRIPMLPRSGVDVSLGAPVAIAGAVLLPPFVAALVGFLGFTNQREFKERPSSWMILYNRAQVGLSLGITALVVSFVQSWFATPVLSLAGGVVAGTITYNSVNTALVALALALLRRLTPSDAARDAASPFPRFFTNFAVASLLSALIVLAYEQVGVLAVLLLSVPLWLGYDALRAARESEDRAEELADRVRELETLNELSRQLLTARTPDEVIREASAGLNHALATDSIEVRRDGNVAEHLDVLKIPECEPAAIGIPHDLSEKSTAMVEAAAGLAGLSLQRLELEEELAEMEKARRRLSEQILEEGQSERSRIALSIHDEVLPYLAAAEMQADNVRTILETPDPQRAAELVDATGSAVRSGITQLREVLEVLRKQVLTPGDLRPSMERLLKELELGEGVTTRLDAPDPLPPLPLAVEILALETVRGCLANIARHAQAEHATIRIDADADRIIVDVLDDGVGFAPEDVDDARHGLQLMTQRVELARGRFDVSSAPGRGTHVRLEVPL
ncbi:sensor histidine kinase [Egibacter rhizosphaerae]|nr:ATP-binding protein [Egibacter rhizosphaerae]